MILAARDESAMALVAHVHGGALGVARRFPGRRQGVDAGRRPSARQKPARALRIAEPAPQPVDDHQLELARTACDQPGACVDVVSGRHEVGQHPGPRGRRWDKPEATRVIVPQRDREDLSRGLLNNLHWRAAVLGRSLHQSVHELLPELSVPGVFSGQALDPLHHELGRLAGEVEHELGRHPEAVGRFATCAWTRLFIAPLFHQTPHAAIQSFRLRSLFGKACAE